MRPIRRSPGLVASTTFALVLLAGCGGEDAAPTSPSGAEPQLDRIEVGPDDAGLDAEGDTTHFEATAIDQNGDVMSGVSFRWESSDETVATVDSDGVATARSEGEVEIMATAESVTGSVALAVELMGERAVAGDVSLPSGAAVTKQELTASSVVSESDVAEADDGAGQQRPEARQSEFRVDVLDVDAPSFVMLLTEEDRPLLAAVAFPEDQGERLTVDAEETAKALVLATPVFTGANGSQYKRAYDRIESQPGFDALVGDVEGLLQSEAGVQEGFLSGQRYLDLQQQAVAIARSVLQDGSAGQRQRARLGIEQDDPTLTESQGEVIVENPDFVYRGVNLTDPRSGAEEGVFLTRTDTEWRFAWPPIALKNGRRSLGSIAGPRDVWISSGFNTDDLADGQNLAPLAANVTQLGVFALSLWAPDVADLDQLPGCAAELGAGELADDATSLVNELASVRENRSFADVGEGLLFDLAIDLLGACGDELGHPALVSAIEALAGSGEGGFSSMMGSLGESLPAIGEGIAQVATGVGNAETAATAGQFLIDWLFEDLTRDPPFNGNLGGTYVQRYAVHGSNGGLAGVTRGGAAWFEWEPDVSATVVLDGSSTDVSAPEPFLGLEEGGHSWEISHQDFEVESGTFDVSASGWTVVERELEAPPVTIRIEPADPPELAVNQAQEFEAVAVDSDGDRTSLPGTPQWSSSDASVAEIDQDGVATGLAPGETQIDVEVDGDAAEAPVPLSVIDVEAQPSASTTESSMDAASPDQGEAELCVAVSDVDGGPVQGLAAGDFDVPDVDHGGGTLTFDPRSLAAGPTLGTGSFSAALVIDQSGSMVSTDPSDARLTAAKQFAQEMEAGDETAVFSFSSSTRQETGFTSSPGDVADVVDAFASPSGGTALYDAGIDACNFAADNAANGNRAVVLLTDGQDNQSTNSASALVDECNALGVKVVTVGFADALPEVLARIAADADGVVVHDTDVDVLLSGVRSLPDLLRGDQASQCVTFDVAASGVDLTQGGETSGRINVDLGGATSSRGDLVESFVGATTNAQSTVSAPFVLEWPAVQSTTLDSETFPDGTPACDGCLVTDEFGAAGFDFDDLTTAP